MSGMVRESGRKEGETSCNGIGLVRRMAHLPRNILGGFSRVIGGGRRTQHFPSNFPQYPQDHLNIVPEEWAFLTSFEQQYGTTHPFFYSCGFMEALKIAEDEKKFMFVYLHSPEHPFTPSFCRETLCSELVVQFLDTNFVCWGALASRGEGLQMAAKLRPASYPFCEVVAPAPDGSITVLQQMEGPITPAELVEILQRTMEQQGVAFGCTRSKDEEKIRSDRRLREEQDAEYFAALQADKERERLKNLALQERTKNPETSKKVNNERFTSNRAVIQSSRVRQSNANGGTMQQNANKGKDANLTQILIRFPSGERREKSFSCAETIQSIYNYIDSLAVPGLTNYRLISSFPRKVYGIDQMGMTLGEAGLYPRASLFLGLLSDH